MCFAFGTSWTSRAWAIFCAASATCPKSGGVSAGSLPVAINDGT
jgi:hypothetical protein